jgi:predicted alpha/beta superfamily hydrolase
MKKIFIVLVLVASPFIVNGQGDLILARYHKIYSEKIGENREINVSVPEEYESKGKRYPVIYMMDGELNATPGFIGGIRYLESLGKMPEFIIVGIRNTDRGKDVFPDIVTFSDGTQDGGRADKYLGFIHEELIPFIEKNYRTENYRILFGTSNSGFTTVYDMFKNQGFFNAYIAASATLSIPSFNSARDSLVKNWQGGARTLVLVMGENDFPTIIRLNGALKEVVDINNPEGLSCRLSVIQGEGHVPASSIVVGLESLFQDWKQPGTGLSGNANGQAPVIAGKLNQVELMKQFIGSWKSELGKDTILIADNEPFGTGMLSRSQITVKGNVIESVTQLYGYDKAADKYIIAELIKSSPVIEICHTWFTSNNRGEIVVVNPENAPFRFKFEFRTPDMIVQTAIRDNQLLKEVTLRRIKVGTAKK